MTVEAYIINNDASELIPMGDINEAYSYKMSKPETVLIGERGGAKCQGFDYGNYPSAIKNVNFSGKTVIHTTSAGTQGIINAHNATEIITGSFVNAKAIVKYIKKRNPDEVSLVCMGLEGKKTTTEDRFCAEYIKSLLEDEPIKMSTIINECKKTDGAKFFKPKNNLIFPTEDFWLCLEANVFDFVLSVEKGDDGLFRTIRKDV
ncbi:MAG: 2-phosphosulfolactate phosphatase [Clostridia bacterium]|nr:2-phosphosulfolactate phosphatase [Clostridia bacterium]